tara:strand:+ start:2850 stop:3050 length:201 start_codon:yes stop_codon:yes gene_type:complete
MKIGDLVKFRLKFRGLENLIGVIIAENGNAFDILWSAPVAAPFGAGGASHIQTEPPEFLEVISEDR